MTRRFTVNCPNVPGCIIIQRLGEKEEGESVVEGKILVGPAGGEGRRMGRATEIWAAWPALTLTLATSLTAIPGEHLPSTHCTLWA